MPEPLSLNFDNPLEPGYDDISLDPFDLQDARSANMLKNQAMDEFTRRNVFKGVNEFTGIVILDSQELESNVPSGLWDSLKYFGNPPKKIRFKIHIPSIHAFIGNPCDIGSLKRIAGASAANAAVFDLANKRIENHPWFHTINSIEASSRPAFGDVVRVKFSKGPAGGKTIEGRLVEIIATGVVDSIVSICPAGTKEAFAAAGGTQTMGGGSPQIKNYTGKKGARKAINGKLPAEILQASPEAHGRTTFVTDIVPQFDGLAKAFSKRFSTKTKKGGITIKLILTDSYRTYEGQVALRARHSDGKPATATPGTSRHGWGLAFDFNTNDRAYGIPGDQSGFDSEVYKWLYANAGGFGFGNPSWARKGGRSPEAWHFEYTDSSKIYSDITVTSDPDD